MSEVEMTDAYKVVRALARETFRTNFAAATPDATDAEELAAWQASDKTLLRKAARKTLRLLERRGITFTVTSSAVANAD